MADIDREPQPPKTQTRRQLFRSLLERSRPATEEPQAANPQTALPESSSQRDPVQVAGRWTRRRFVQGLAAGGALATLQPVNKLLRNVGILDQGNLFQVAGETGQVLWDLVHNPDPESQAVALAWLKMNAGIYYAQQEGMFLAAGMMRHFLYGEGEALHQAGYPEALRRMFQIRHDQLHQPLPDIDLSDHRALLLHQLRQVFEQEVSDVGIIEPRAKPAGRSHGPFFKQANGSNTGYVDAAGAGKLLGQRGYLFGVVSPIGLDQNLVLALGDFTLGVVGQVEKVQAGALTFSQPRAVIADTYDWSRFSQLDATANLGAYLDDLGLTSKLPEPWRQRLLGTTIGITDREGALLQKQGIGHKFRIRLEYELGDRVTIKPWRLEPFPGAGQAAAAGPLD